MAKKKAKTAQQLKKECLAALQKLVRLKAADENGYCKCVSCGVVKPWNDGMQGGHFIPKGNCSYWALKEENVHPQCVYCNQFGMKNGVAAQEYTLYMQETYGHDFVEQMLEDKSRPFKMYTADYRDMLEDLKEQIKYQLERIGQ